MPIIEGIIKNVVGGGNMLGLNAYKLTIKTEKKLINIVDFGYERSDVWTSRDIGKKGVFEYGFGLNGREMKHSRMEK